MLLLPNTQYFDVLVNKEFYEVMVIIHFRVKRADKERWMNDLRFHVLFNSISVILGQ